MKSNLSSDVGDQTTPKRGPVPDVYFCTQGPGESAE